MDRRRTLEESMREMTLEDGRPDDPDPPASLPESSMMDLDDGGGRAAAAESRRRQHGNVVPLQQQQHPWRTLALAVPATAAAAPPEGTAAVAGRGVPPPAPNARAPARDVEDILLELLPEGSVLVGYTVDGYLFA